MTGNPIRKKTSSEQKDLKFIRADKWESWLKRYHDEETGVWVVFPKKSANEPSINYEEALDIALAYGWIDISIRKIDERTFARKFTPRREESSWTESNINNVERLTRAGKMTEWGLAAYERVERFKGQRLNF